MKKVLYVIMCVAFVLCGIRANAADTWPDKAIQVIVPWGAGGGSDLSARIVMDKVSQILGQPVVVTNVTGAAGLNGALKVFNSRPDGYTILWEHPANLAIAPHIGKAKYTWKDFEMVGSVGSSDIAVFVSSKSPWKTMRELVDYAKANPGKLKWSCQPNAASHFTLLEVEDSEGGLDIKVIPGSGDKQRIINVMNGTCDVTTAGYAAVAPYVKSGDVRILAMASPERSVLAPEYPTLMQDGIKAESVFLYSAEMPKGTPQDIIKKLQMALEEACKDPKVIELLKQQGIVAKYRDAAQTNAIWEKEAEIYLRLAKQNNLIK